MTDKIIILPEIQQLKNDINQLNQVLTQLVFERDELLYKTCKNIENEYILQLGALEYKVYDLQSLRLRLERKIELIQIRLDEEESINFNQIEEALDMEFESNQQERAHKIDQINNAIEYSQKPKVTQDEVNESRYLYRQIVTYLHPDLHPNLEEHQLKLFMHAVESFEKDDIAILKLVELLLNHESDDDVDRSSLEKLMREKERLQEIEVSIQTEIQHIKSSYPYILKPIVDNVDRIQEKKLELESTVAELKEIVATYRGRLQEIVR